MKEVRDAIREGNRIAKARGLKCGTRIERVKMTTKISKQDIARLVYASNVGVWRSAHPHLKPALTGLCRRGLLERIDYPQSLLHDTLALTDTGKDALRAAGIAIHDDRAAGKANELVPDAEFVTDQWQQVVPA